MIFKLHDAGKYDEKYLTLRKIVRKLSLDIFSYTAFSILSSLFICSQKFLKECGRYILSEGSVSAPTDLIKLVIGDLIGRGEHDGGGAGGGLAVHHIVAARELGWKRGAGAHHLVGRVQGELRIRRAATLWTRDRRDTTRHSSRHLRHQVRRHVLTHTLKITPEIFSMQKI